MEKVNHPSHYTRGNIETIEIIKELTNGYAGFEGLLVGNITKYISRANFKGNKLQDLKKAQWYFNRLVKEVENGIQRQETKRVSTKLQEAAPRTSQKDWGKKSTS